MTSARVRQVLLLRFQKKENSMKNLKRWMLFVVGTTLMVVSVVLLCSPEFHLSLEGRTLRLAAIMGGIGSLGAGGFCIMRFGRNAISSPAALMYPLMILEAISGIAFMCLAVGFLVTVGVCVKFNYDATFLRQQRTLFVGLMFTSLFVLSAASSTRHAIRFRLPPRRIRIYRERE